MHNIFDIEVNIKRLYAQKSYSPEYLKIALVPIGASPIIAGKRMFQQRDAVILFLMPLHYYYY